MDFIKLLGGLALGATGAALFDALRPVKKIGTMGQGVFSGGFGGGGPSGGGFGGGFVGPGMVSGPAGGPAGASGGGPGLVVGPPTGGFGGGVGPVGPGVITTFPEGAGEGEQGPIVSVPPEVVGPGLPGGSFFGINTSPWFWPLNVNWLYPQPPRSMVCVKRKNENDEEVTICQEAYNVQPLWQNPATTYAWGPPMGWL